MRLVLTPARVELAVRLAAELFAIDPDLLGARSRIARVAQARQALMYALYTVSDATFEELGRALGRNHTTIIHGCQVAEQLARVDADFAVAIAALMQEVRHG